MPSLFLCTKTATVCHYSDHTRCQDVQTGCSKLHQGGFNQPPQTGAPGCQCISAGCTAQALGLTHTVHGDHTQEST